MKKISIMVVLALLVATPAMTLSVVNSKHDMVFSGFADAPVGNSTEVCVFCHTPHGAQITVTQAPLWNNTAATSVDATLYNSVTRSFNVTQAQVNATDARLCLACHDGGVGEPVNQPNSGPMEISLTTLMNSNALLGTNMSNDHPIGMDLGADPETVDVHNTMAGMHTIADITGPGGFGENPFYGVNNTMWCSSCHDVHDNADVPFLRINNVGSHLCKTCHVK